MSSYRQSVCGPGVAITATGTGVETAAQEGEPSRRLNCCDVAMPIIGAGHAMRFTVPAIVNGRVYMSAKGEVDVYDLVSK